MQLTLLGIVLALLIVWLFVRRRGQAKPDRRTATVTTDKGTAYHAVSIKFEEGACAAATEMSGRRFLSSAAPRLPLAECDALDCRCRFSHHSDRRIGKDRRSPFARSGFGGGTGSFEAERRERPDRRKDADLGEF